MIVRVRAYLKGMKREDQLKILKALDIGLTESDLRAAEKEPQEFEVKLFKPKEAVDEPGSNQDR